MDFRSSEASNYLHYVQKKRFPGPPGKHEVYLMVSKSANQLLWVLNVQGSGQGTQGYGMIDTRRWRLGRGTWNPDLLENYANAVGLSLVGFKRFEDSYRESRKH